MVEDNNSSILAAIGSAICIIFAPLGFGDWQSTVAVFTGLIAKENVVPPLALFGVGRGSGRGRPRPVDRQVAAHYTPGGLQLYDSQPAVRSCFAAMGAIKREMNNWKWTPRHYACAVIGVVSFIVYQRSAPCLWAAALALAP